MAEAKLEKARPALEEAEAALQVRTYVHGYMLSYSIVDPIDS